MPKAISKSKIKLKLGADFSSVDNLVKILTGDPNYIEDINLIYNRATEFNAHIKKYMLVRFNMGKTVSNAYTEAGTRFINDTQQIIAPIKNYLKIMDTNSKKFIGVLEQNKDAIVEYKKTYLSFKKSKIILDAIVICNNITDFDFASHTYEDICTGDVNIQPFKSLAEYESEQLNLKFVFVDNEISPELKVELYDELKTLREVTSEIHQMYNTPDMDIKNIFPMLMEFLDSFLGDLKGCKSAKGLIKNSSDMFIKRFDNYFKNFQVTESPFGIIEDFISDIIIDKKNDNHLDAKILTELSTILTTVRKKLGKNSAMMKNPNFNKAINMVEKVLHHVTNLKDNDKQDNIEDVNKNMVEVIGFLSEITGELKNNTNADE